jgi:16S rRNA (cytidine1402-2'-O)-methyltransferase
MPTLIVAAMPIDGDWRRLDPRVIDAVKSCNLLIAEEKKTAMRLLAATDSRDKPVCLINEHSTDSDRAEVLKNIISTDVSVLISDAGTPCIADPDWVLVDMCIKNGVNVVSAAGASSITTALSVSGFPAKQFIFLGFPPKEQKKRKKFFVDLGNTKMTAVFLERPYALKQTLADLAEFTRPVSISVALGTPDEKNLRGLPRELTPLLEGVKAAFTVVVGK